MNNITITYIVLSIIWIIIICVFKLYDTDIIGWLIIAIPFIVFAIGAYNSDVPNAPNAVIAADNTLSLGVLLVIPLLAWVDRNNFDTHSSRNRFIGIVLIAIVMYLLSYVVLWVPERFIPIANRVTTAFSTMSAILLIYAIYLYYRNRTSRVIQIPEDIYKQYDAVSLNY
jgi:hypothetical protein